MNGKCQPGRTCPDCGALLIHQNKRHHHESASVVGQAVHDVAPKDRTWNDIDGVLHRYEDHRLRIYEHKSPLQEFSPGQWRLLFLLSRLIEHWKSCPGVPGDAGLSPDSGVYLLRGSPVDALHLGPHYVSHLVYGERVKPALFTDDAELIAWLSGCGPERMDYIRAKLQHRREEQGL